MMDTDGTQDIINELSKAHNVKEWLNIAWKVGLFIITLVYIKTIIKTCIEILKEIWQAFVGKDKKLDPKELMGITMWVFTICLMIKYLNSNEINIELFLMVVGYFCIMFGIEKLTKVKIENEK